MNFKYFLSGLEALEFSFSFTFEKTSSVLTTKTRNDKQDFFENQNKMETNKRYLNR